jgi:hypothetical protein
MEQSKLGSLIEAGMNILIHGDQSGAQLRDSALVQREAAGGGAVHCFARRVKHNV